MAVLVTRPHPDNERTAASLRGKGIEAVLAPMLRFEPVAFVDDSEAHYDGVIATSANALRAIDSHPAKSRLLDLPLFAVGERTAEAARATGFHNAVAGNVAGKTGAAALPDLIEAFFKDQRKSGNKGGSRSSRKKSGPQAILLYLAGADIARDVSGELGERGFSVITQTTYRMIPVLRLPLEARDAFAANNVDAVLHYSRRSASSFVAAVRADGVEIAALALPQCCISDAVAMVLRDAGAAQVILPRSTDEDAMIEAAVRAVGPPRGA